MKGGIIFLAIGVGIVYMGKPINGQCVQSLTTVSGRNAPKGRICAKSLIFNENFDRFDTNLWQHEHTMYGGGNGAFQWYDNDRRNSFVQNGKLVIRPTLTTDIIPNLENCHIKLNPCDTPWAGCEHKCSKENPGPPVRSALVHTTDTFAFKYGRVEIRAKLPTGDWLWPALWFKPKISKYGAWPRSGEIDLMEMKGNPYLFDKNGHNIGVEEFGSTLHFGTEKTNSAWWSSFFARRSPVGWGWNRDYHLYQMEWAPTHISFSVDGKWIGTIPVGDGFFRRGRFTGYNPWANGTLMAPFDQEFYFIINLAVGGTNGYFPDTGNRSGKPWKNSSKTARRDFWNGRDQWLPGWRLHENNAYDASLIVDHVRLWAL